MNTTTLDNTLPILYDTNSSYHCMIARLGLAEKGVPYEKKVMDIHVRLDQLNPVYARIQPQLTVPTFQYRNDVIDSSFAIIQFVDRTFEGPRLTPQDQQQLQIMMSLIELHYHYDLAGLSLVEHLTMGTLFIKKPMIKKVISHGLNKAIKKCEAFAKAHPELASIYEAKITLSRDRLAHLVVHNELAHALEQTNLRLDQLETVLQDKMFLLGEDYSLADVVWTCFLGRLYMIDRTDLIKARPALQQYWQRVSSRPSFKSANIWTRMHVSKVLYMLLGLIF